MCQLVTVDPQQQKAGPTATSVPASASDGSASASDGSASASAPRMIKRPVNRLWTHWTEHVLHRYIRRAIVGLSTHAARRPKTYIASITFLSFALIITGFFTNFQIVYNHEEFFTPIHSLPEQHAQWIREESGFEQTRPFLMLLHNNGDNVLQFSSSTSSSTTSAIHHHNLRSLFQAVDTIVRTDGYEQVCSQSSYTNAYGQSTCKLSSATQFWNHDIDQFETDLLTSKNSGRDDDTDWVRQQLSNTTFPDGTPVFHEAILGNYQMMNLTSGEMITVHDTMSANSNNGMRAFANTTAVQASTLQDDNLALLLQSAQSFIVKIDIPDLGSTTDQLEERILNRLHSLRRQQFANQIQLQLHLEYFTMYAYQLEFESAIYQDIPLVVVMMCIMVGFCCLVFYDRHDQVQSRSLMGLFSIATIGMSLMTGYGMVWIVGVPFTNIAMMVPFVVVGIGLDDTFISKFNNCNCVLCAHDLYGLGSGV